MRRNTIAITSSLVILFAILFLAAASPAAGISSFLQPSATSHQQTLDAIVANNLTQTAVVYDVTQTAVTENLYATAEAQFQPEATATPNPGMDASDRARAIEAHSAGWIFYWSEDYTAAYLAFDLAIDYAPNWAEGYVGRAMTNYTLGRDEEARADFERAIELDPGGGDLYSWHASLASNAGDFRVAMDDYEQMIAINPNIATLYSNRGLTYMQMGRYDNALADYNRAAELDPTLPYVFRNRNEYYLLHNEYGKSLIDGYISDGLYAFDREQYSQAVEEFTRAINVEQYSEDYSPSYAYAHFNLGRTHLELGNYDLALEEFDEALTLNPGLTHAILGQGDVYARQGMWDQALIKYEQAIERRPALQISYLKCAIAHDALDHHAAATANYWEWIQRDELRPVTWDYYNFGQPFVIHLEDTWSYYIPVEGQAGQLFSATATTLPIDNDVDPLLVLLDPDGHPIAANNDINAYIVDAALQDIVLPVNGQYTLVVSHAIGYDGPALVTLERGAVLSAADITATVDAYTPTPTPTATLTPSFTPTPTATPSPTATLSSSAFDFVSYRSYNYDSIGGGAFWQDDNHLIVSDFHGVGMSEITETGLKTSWMDANSGFIAGGGISSDGTLLALGVGEDHITLYDAQTGQQLNTLFGHTSYIRHITFNRANTLMASAGLDSRMIIWDTTTGLPVAELSGSFHSAAFSPDGTLLAVAPTFRNIELWDISDPNNVHQVTEVAGAGNYGGHIINLSVLAFSPDGSLLAGVNGSDVILWETTAFTEVGRLSGHTDSINTIAFSPDGTLLASGSDDRTVRLWHVPYRVEIAVLDESKQNGRVAFVQFNHSGDRLLAEYENDVVWIWSNNPADTAAPIKPENEAIPATASFTPTASFTLTASYTPTGTVPVTQAAPTVAAAPAEIASAEQVQAAQYLADGWNYVFLGSYQQAVNSFGAAIELSPGWVEPYIGRGLAYRMQLDITAAKTDFDYVLGVLPGDAYTLSWRAVLFLITVDYAQALQDLNQQIDLNPQEAIGYSNRGFVYLQTNRTAEALAEFVTAVALDPTDSYYFDDRQRAYEALGETDLALFDSYLRSGLDQYEAGLYSVAVLRFQQALDEFPHITTADPVVYAYYNLARAYTELGETAQAREALEAAIALDPNYALPYHQMGKTYAAVEDYTTAIAYYSQAIQANPAFKAAYLDRALAYDARDQTELAAADYWQWISLSNIRIVNWPVYVPGEFIPIAVQRGWTYHIPFSGSAGQTIRIQTELVDPASGIDVIIAVVDSAGQPLAVDNDGGPNPHEDQLEMVLPADGTYTLVLTHGVKPKGIVRFRIENQPLTAPAPMATSTSTPTPSATPSPSPTMATTGCSVRASAAVNLRTGPGTNFAIADALTAGQVATVDGRAVSADDSVWWHLSRDAWVRADVVDTIGDCDNVPLVTSE